MKHDPWFTWDFYGGEFFASFTSSGKPYQIKPLRPWRFFFGGGGVFFLRKVGRFSRVPAGIAAFFAVGHQKLRVWKNGCFKMFHPGCSRLG